MTGPYHPSESRRPNLLLLMTDQHRWDWVGYHGSNVVDTPALDGLAARGMRFTHCISSSPICAPARIGLAAGVEPYRLGALDNDSLLPIGRRTYYMQLRDSGYHVGCVGKLDLAKPYHYNGRRGQRPAVFSWGFTHPLECEGKRHAGRFPEPVGPYGAWLEQRGLYERFHEDYLRRRQAGWIEGACHDSVLPTDAFEDSYIGERACEWIRSQSGEFPWHLFVSFVGPHDPFDPPTEYAQHYRGRDMPEPVPGPDDGKPRWVRERAGRWSNRTVTEARRQYSAAIRLIDDQIAKIVETLEATGQRENTCILFCSDHGELLGDHGLFFKSAPYEPAVRVPFFATGPGIVPGSSSDELVALIDINPTLCELAGIAPPEHTDGRSLCDVLQGKGRAHRAEVLIAMKHFRAIRTGRYKLVENVNDSAELYDLQEDPMERRNVAGGNPRIVEELSRRLKELQVRRA